MQNHHRKSSSFVSTGIPIVGGAIVALSLLWAFWPMISFSFTSPNPNNFKTGVDSATPGGLSGPGGSGRSGGQGFNFNLTHDPPESTFYDDPNLTYTIEKPITNWDQKRREWLWLHPSFIPGLETRVLLVTGSQSTPCQNPIGDHLLLRFFKNKVDYCRIHGYDIFYNNVLLHPEMFTYWAKIPAVRAAMLAHPETEWIWWVDSDAAFTDMDFKLPLHRYKDYNFVVHGWPELIYKKKSWTSLNAGVFLIRNSQWALDFMDVWAGMGPQTPNYEKWGELLRKTCKDKFFPESDDQTGLVYLLLKEKEKWGNKIYVEDGYYFEGYWMEIVGKLENITEKYNGVEKRVSKLRRRHAEKVRGAYVTTWEEYLKGVGYGREGWRRPFMTHFTGCQPCSGTHNEEYSMQGCWDAMQKVLNFGDNQVLRNYGFVHPSLGDSGSVMPLPFDYPA
ncbi:putative xyloglucan 6-xylosyltransferase [Helianthus annuus]|nr:putative xyloglucan 6-xylosyltransferase [Helianthus annuus]